MAAETDEAFRQLNDAELAALGPLGVRRAVSAGEYLYREGDAGYDYSAHAFSRWSRSVPKQDPARGSKTIWGVRLAFPVGI